MSKILNNEEIVNKMMKLLGHPTKAALLRDLDVSKQSLSQFAKQGGIDINNKIISLLIKKLSKSG